MGGYTDREDAVEETPRPDSLRWESPALKSDLPASLYVAHRAETIEGIRQGARSFLGVM